MPDLKAIKKVRDLDKEVRASGFNHLKDMDYVTEMLNQRREKEADFESDDGGQDEDEEYLLQENVETGPKLLFGEGQEDGEEAEAEVEREDEAEDSGREEDEKAQEAVAKGPRKKKRMKEDKYIRKVVRSKFKRKKKVPYNRNRNKAKGKLLQSLGL